MGRAMTSAFAESLAGTVGGSVARRDPIGVEEEWFVARKRAECPHIGWQALANMTQRNVHDLRMRCDPEYRRQHLQSGGGRPKAAGSGRSSARFVHQVHRPATRVALLDRDADARRVVELLAIDPATIWEVRDALGATNCIKAKRVLQNLRNNQLVSSAAVEGWSGHGRAPHRYFLTEFGETEAIRLGLMAEPSDG